MELEYHGSQTETATLGEIINRIADYRHTDNEWYDVMCIDIDGLEEALADGENDDFEKASEIEAAYIRKHENDVYEIRWPEHVITPRYNGDASYLLMEAAE